MIDRGDSAGLKSSKPMEIFGSSGIRAIADRRLFELGFAVGLAVGSRYSRVITGSDTRTSRGALKHAVTSGLLAAGAACHDAGLVTTPTLALAARGFDTGAMVTASHNPPEYNGIKLLNPDGSGFDGRQRREIERLIADPDLTAAPWQQLRDNGIYTGAVEEHIDRILKDFPGGFKLRVALDCGCGAASTITPYLLSRMGCEVISINCYPSGLFPHDVEPTEANLTDLSRATREFNADLGVAHDGDADRMMAVDDKGRFISGDRLLAIFAQALGAKKVVTTVDASMAVDEMGVEVKRTRVGDIYVSEELRTGGDFGGEPSGAWIFPAVSFCPDGIYAAGQLLSIACQSRLSGLVDRIPRYPIHRGSVPGSVNGMPLLEKQLREMNPVSVETIDGIRLNFGDGWVLVRPSGTEPKVRITVEARDESKVRAIYDDAEKIVRDCVEK